MLQSVTGNMSPVLQERSWPQALLRQRFPAADLVAWRWPNLLRPISSPHILALIRPAQRQPPAIPTEVLAALKVPMDTQIGAVTPPAAFEVGTLHNARGARHALTTETFYWKEDVDEHCWI